MNFINSKIKASIIEQLVALVIIVSVFSGGFLLLSNALGSNNTENKVRADVLVNNALNNLLLSKAYNSETFKYEGLTIEQKVQAHKNSNSLLIVTIEAYDSKNKVISSRKRIVVQ